MITASLKKAIEVVSKYPLGSPYRIVQRKLNKEESKIVWSNWVNTTSSLKAADSIMSSYWSYCKTEQTLILKKDD